MQSFVSNVGSGAVDWSIATISITNKYFLLSIFLNIYLLRQAVHVEVAGQLSGVSSHLSSCRGRVSLVSDATLWGTVYSWTAASTSHLVIKVLGLEIRGSKSRLCVGSKHRTLVLRPTRLMFL